MGAGAETSWEEPEDSITLYGDQSSGHFSHLPGLLGGDPACLQSQGESLVPGIRVLAKGTAGLWWQ